MIKNTFHVIKNAYFQKQEADSCPWYHDFLCDSKWCLTMAEKRPQYHFIATRSLSITLDTVIKMAEWD